MNNIVPISGLCQYCTGRFQAHMQLELVNDGPVTIMLDSRDRLQPR
ncbi:D-tyrosyl-tRNA(Tyr) deacylase [Dehalogenimonas sp. WBC-2]|nr:D-tyrosyl-tRNA(Tyr) deacylase [Dehalogenimonas sp. WBC-2]